MPCIDVPPDLQCSITGSIFVDPVITCDGQTYERSAIKEWFDKGKNTSPLTNLVLDHIYLAVDLETTKKVKAFQAKLIDDKEFQKALFYQDVKTLEDCLYTEDQLCFETIEPCIHKDKFKAIEWLWSKQIDKFDTEQVFRLAVDCNAFTICSWLLAKKPSFLSICWSLPVTGLQMAKLFVRCGVPLSYSSLRFCRSFQTFRYVFDILNSKTCMVLPKKMTGCRIETFGDLVRDLMHKGLFQQLNHVFESVSNSTLQKILQSREHDGRMLCHLAEYFYVPEVFSTVLDVYNRASLDLSSLCCDLGGTVLYYICAYGCSCPSKPLWGSSPSKPLWGSSPSKPLWGSCPSKPLWGSCPSKPLWGTKETIQALRLFKTKVGKIKNEPHIWEMVASRNNPNYELIHYFLMQNGFSASPEMVASNVKLVALLMQDSVTLRSMTDEKEKEKEKGEKRKLLTVKKEENEKKTKRRRKL
jgi:hypothetical protein